MNLVTDIGNTLVKVAVFDNGQIVERFVSNVHSRDLLKSIAGRFPIKKAILSSVVKDSAEIAGYLEHNFRFVEFTDKTRIPIKNFYETPETLGRDRLAGAIAANNLYPGRNVLVIDAGTCIKYDLITAEGAYLGGAISPGISMRFKALHTFTGKLPLLGASSVDYLIGKNTVESIHSGVLNGVYAEVDGIINQYRAVFPEMLVLLTGGNISNFEGKLKNAIFAVPDLQFTGLNIILEYNAEE
ncbi:MAG: type III pantothenate kinase [Bacteroidota bacterium]